MSIMFSPLKIGPMTIKNRFMRSPVYEAMGNPDGTPKPQLLTLIEKLAKGQVGLIIPGYVYSMESGKAAPKQCALYDQKHSDAWKPAIKKVHEQGSKIVFQVCHGGIGVLPELEKRSPSTFPGTYRGLSTSEIEDIINSYVKAASLAQKAGADGVEIHGAHGYLYSLFLSPQFNLRSDKYGGSLENRARIVAETAEAIRKMAGPDFSILIKMNGNDFLPFGVTPDLASQYVNFLKGKIDMFEISCGISNVNAIIRTDRIRKLIKYTYDLNFSEAYNLSYAELIKRKNPDTIVASVGGFRTFSAMEDAVASKKVDLVSLARPLIREPDLVKRMQKDRNTKSACISCNRCLLFNGTDKRGTVCDYP